MKFKRLLSIFLCLMLVLTLFVACDEKDDDDDDRDDDEAMEEPETVEDILKLAEKAYKKLSYREVENTTKTINFDGSVNEDKEVIVGNYQGNNCAMFMTEEDTEPSMIFFDGVMYNVENNKKFAMDLEEAATIIGNSGIADTLAEALEIEDVTIEKGEDGNTVVKGKKLKNKDLLNGLVGGVVGSIGDASGVGLNVNITDMEYVLVFDEEYRLINKRVFMVYDMAIGQGGMSMSASCSTLNECTYEYGDQYAVDAPADTDSYEEASSYMDFIS